MRVEFFVNPSEGLSGVLAPIAFHDCPTSPRGHIQFGGRATLCMNGDRHILNLQCDAMPSIDADALLALVEEDRQNQMNFMNPRQERGSYALDIPLKSLRSQWTGDRLLCYAEVGQAPSSSMEIPGVRTVLVLCDRQHYSYFHEFFLQRQPDRVTDGVATFGQTRYVYIQGQNWRGLRPEQTRWATLGPCPVANLERLNEAEAIASQYERIFLEEDREPVESSRYTAAEVMEQRALLPRVNVLEAFHRSVTMMEADSVYRQLMEQSEQSIRASMGLGMRQSIPRGIGDTSCINNARDRNLRCAVNPCGPCEGCGDYKKRDD